ncbi:MAG: tRNA (guanosine(46)-N7)-methyltransferase TrmB [Planctomycetota bacterium]
MTRDYFHFDPERVAVGECESFPDAIGVGDKPLHIEIGFGKDIRTLRMAERDPDAFFLGIEISRKKCIKFGQKVARANLPNVRCHWGDARKALEEMLPENSVDSFTILFPDPWPKRKHHKHRWVQEKTAALMARALKPHGHIIAATDHDHYRDQIRRVMAGAGFVETRTLDHVPEDDKSLFAERFERIGESITYMRWEKGAGDRPTSA